MAVLGSVLSSTYRGEIEGHLGGVPAALRSLAGESVEGHPRGRRSSARRAGTWWPRVPGLPGRHASAIASAAIALVGAAVVAAFLPGRAPADPGAGAPGGRPEGDTPGLGIGPGAGAGESARR